MLIFGSNYWELKTGKNTNRLQRVEKSQFLYISLRSRPSDRSGRILENCDLAVHKIGKGTGARHRKRGFFEFLRPNSGRKIPIGREASRAYFEIRTTSRASRPCVAKLSVREFEESCTRNLSEASGVDFVYSENMFLLFW